jgi:hypothetical protein
VRAGRLRKMNETVMAGSLGERRHCALDQPCDRFCRLASRPVGKVRVMIFSDRHGIMREHLTHRLDRNSLGHRPRSDGAADVMQAHVR